MCRVCEYRVCVCRVCVCIVFMCRVCVCRVCSRVCVCRVCVSRMYVCRVCMQSVYAECVCVGCVCRECSVCMHRECMGMHSVYCVHTYLILAMCSILRYLPPVLAVRHRALGTHCVHTVGSCQNLGNWGEIILEMIDKYIIS